MSRNARPRPETHRCPGNCGRIIPNTRFACTRDWARLPEHLQAAINTDRNPITNIARQLRADAVRDARDWYLENPAPADPDAGIAGECEHCHAPLLWLTTDAGKRMPVDADPRPDGNVVRIGKAAGVLGPQKAAAARSAGTPLWLHHVVSCPHADRWRSKPAARPSRKPARR